MTIASAAPALSPAARPRLLRAYAAAVATGALLLFASLLVAGYSFGPFFALAALSTLALLAERQSIRLTPTLEFSVSSLVYVFAGVVFGPVSAMLVGAIGLLVTFQAPYLRWVIWTSSRALGAGAASLVAVSLGSTATQSFSVLLLAVLAASLVQAACDLIFHSATPALRGTGTFRGVAYDFLPVLAASIPLHAPVIAVLAYAYIEISAWTVALFLGPAFAAHRLFLLYHHQRLDAGELEKANAKLTHANLSFATALVAALDARDEYTAGHSAAVATYARDIAVRMGLSLADVELAYRSGLVHDIGKIGLPAGLLEKQGPLTLDERRQMEAHSKIGERILSKVDNYSDIAKIVRCHHERWDGCGYPDRLRGPDIPIVSRIIAVADAYDAMTSDRPYREAMPSRVARLRLAQGVQTHFDTAVVAAFEAILAGADESYRMGQRLQFADAVDKLVSRAERSGVLASVG